jgi:hypothetical protein
MHPHLPLNRRLWAIVVLAICSREAAASEDQSREATSQAHLSSPHLGVVLLDVNWGRRWGCGDFQNAELRQLSFDRVPPFKPTGMANGSYANHAPQGSSTAVIRDASDRKSRQLDACMQSKGYQFSRAK